MGAEFGSSENDYVSALVLFPCLGILTDQFDSGVCLGVQKTTPIPSRDCACLCRGHTEILKPEDEAGTDRAAGASGAKSIHGSR